MKIFAAIFIIAAGICVSCNKNSDKQANCRIVTLTQTNAGTNTISNITYNNDGRISTFSTSGTNGDNRVFTYNGNTVFATRTNNDGDLLSSDSITLDGRRRPLNIRQFFDEDKTNWTNYSFEYSGDDLLKINQTSSSSGPQTNVATSLNGNMISLQSAGSTATLEYFTDKKVQQGDYLEMASFIQYGIGIYPHKNLVKTIASGSSILNFNYDFNADGTISKVTATTGGSITSLSYQYDCK